MSVFHGMLELHSIIAFGLRLYGIRIVDKSLGHQRVEVDLPKSSDSH